MPALVLQTVASVLYGAIVMQLIRLKGPSGIASSSSAAACVPTDRSFCGRLPTACPPQGTALFQTGQESLHLFVVSSWFDATTFAIYSVGCLQILSRRWSACRWSSS